ncbi:MAG: HlyD family efflux transporter periplasmic adaptor subunit [Rhodobacteraceae bacterium]|nr:HlyD family efflux transporter periplasmic adaptor subunit [Paracoccaceae bacterium]
MFRWRKRPRNPDKPPRTDTDVLVAMRAARTLTRMHISATFALALASLVCVLGLFGAIFTLQNQTVDHVLRVNGVLQAIEQSTPVTHNTGGVVSNVFVTNGEIVTEGQILMSLDASDIEEELQTAQRAVVGLMLQSLCLQAELNARTEFQVAPELRVALGRLNQIEKLQRSVRDCKLHLRQVALQKLKQHSGLVSLQDQVNIHTRLSGADRSLRGRLRQVAQEPGGEELQEILSLQSLTKTLRNSLKHAELRKQLIDYQVKTETAKLEAETKLRRRLDQITDGLAAAEARLAELDQLKQNRFVYASDSGRVQRLRVKEGGKRIARGAYILEIAPLTTDFEVLATVSVADLSYVRVGQPVTVGLSSGLPRPVFVPAVIARITKATENTRALSIAIARESLNKRDLLIGDRSLNGLGERSEALIEVQAENAFRSLRRILTAQFVPEPV